ncbi:MAG: esterase/lipase family protein [Micropepsaceae bacterium]
MTDEPISPPPRRLLFLEPRGLIDIPTLFIAAPFLLTAPRGRKHGVVVLPGFGADDRSTLLLRRYLSLLGYDVQGWNRGRNVRRPGEDLPAVIAQIKALRTKHNAAVTLIGWSRGGIMAREIARQVPDDIRMVITLGSPFADPNANNVGAIWKLITGEDVPRNPERIEQLAEPIPVPATAIYTKQDGVVAWRACLEREGDNRENVEVRSTHIGLGFHPPALWAIADRLAQKWGTWKPFKPSKLVAPFFPRKPGVYYAG